MRIRAFAKINLALDILDKAKNGYHHISTVFQQIALHDELIFQKLETPEIIIECPNKKIPTGHKNTVYQAIEVMRAYLCTHKKKFSLNLGGLKIIIKKNIPIAGGLGGGSSDAAATLHALNRLWNLKLSIPVLQKLGAKIGMDVPFFIQGGTAYGKNFGEKIQQLKFLKLPPALLFLPRKKNLQKSSAHAYQKIESCRYGLQKAKTVHLRKALGCSKNQHVSHFFHNDFDFLYSKEILNLQKKLAPHKVQALHCTGSGPAIYAIFQNSKNLLKAKKSLQKDYKIWIVN